MPSDIQDLGLLIKQVQHGHHRALDRGLSPHGISLVQWNALREIARNPGASQHRLAELTFNSDQAFGTLLARLRRNGWIAPVPGTGRSTRHELTGRGRTLLAQGRTIMSDVLAGSLGALTAKERQELARLLGAVRARQRPAAAR